MPRDHSKLDQAEIETLCQSIRDHRHEIQSQLTEITGIPESDLRKASESFDFSEYQELALEDDSGKGATSTAKAVASDTTHISKGGAIVKGGGSSRIGPYSGHQTDEHHECFRCGRRQGLVGKYDIWLCRQCFEELARDMGFRKYK